MVIDGLEKGKSVWIIGAGSTLKSLNPEEFKNRTTIGINNMSDFIVPTYHLWTNTQRWIEFGSRCDARSRLLIGERVTNEIVRQHFQGSYIRINYIDKDEDSISYRDGIIRGRFRTAGCLSIVLAHIMGASDINIVGMDGYTLHGRNSIDKKRASQHIYGKGMTDGTSWKECERKDELVNEVLNNIRNFGVKFRITTPTMFKEFSNG